MQGRWWSILVTFGLTGWTDGLESWWCLEWWWWWRFNLDVITWRYADIHPYGMISTPWWSSPFFFYLCIYQWWKKYQKDQKTPIRRRAGKQKTQFCILRVSAKCINLSIFQWFLIIGIPKLSKMEPVIKMNVNNYL